MFLPYTKLFQRKPGTGFALEILIIAPLFGGLGENLSLTIFSPSILQMRVAPHAKPNFPFHLDDASLPLHDQRNHQNAQNLGVTK
jgi:hypothetical protein